MKYEDITYSKENPIQVGDEVNVGGTWLKVVADYDDYVELCKDNECDAIYKSRFKQGRRKIKQETVSGVKVAEVTWIGHMASGEPAVKLSNYVQAGKNYALIELEDGE